MEHNIQKTKPYAQIQPIYKRTIRNDNYVHKGTPYTPTPKTKPYTNTTRVYKHNHIQTIKSYTIYIHIYTHMYATL